MNPQKPFWLCLVVSLPLVLLGCGAGDESEPFTGNTSALTGCRGGPACGGPERRFPGKSFWPRRMGRPIGAATGGASPAAACSNESQCAEGLACVEGTCQPCGAHSQCQSDVCDLYAATSMGPGYCLNQLDVVYANVSAPGCATGTGTRTNPVCTINQGIPLATGRQFAIRAYPGFYPNFSVTDRTLFVYGDGVTLGHDSGVAGVSLLRSRVVLDGLRFLSHLVTAIHSDDSDTQVRRVNINAPDNGITSLNSWILVDRTFVRAHQTYGLKVSGPGVYEITNNVFLGQNDPGVVFVGSNSGRFWFNSILSGGVISPSGLDCGTTPRNIQDSIVYGNVPAPGGAQTVGACNHIRVVVGSADTRTLPGLIKINPDLNVDGSLRYTTANAACCINRGERFVPSLYADFAGTKRPQGSSNDIGAFELAPQTLTLEAAADAHIRTDLDVRRNDNYGCQESMTVGTSRGGGGIPYGGADAMRALVRFDLSSLSAGAAQFLQSATLQMTVDSYDFGLPMSVYQVGAHRVLPTVGLTPWSEGDGLEGTLVPTGCVNVDDAEGVAWVGAGDGGDANNQTQPGFAESAAATATINQSVHVRGDVIPWNLSTLVGQWIGGAQPNHGVLLRDATTDGSFRGVRFGAKDGLLRGFPSYVNGPRLVLNLAP